MKIIYRCDNCESEMKKNDNFCNKCGGMVWKDYIGAGINAELYDKDDPRMCHYLHVVPFYYKTNREKELSVLYDLINRIPEYKNDLRLQKKEELETILKYKDYEVAKVQIIEPNSKNIKIAIVDKNKYIDNPLFDKEKNKNEFFWFSIYDDNNLDKYIEPIKDSIKHFEEFYTNKKD